MKKIIGLFLAVIFVCSMFGCKNAEADVTEPPAEDFEQVQTQPATEDPFRGEAEIDISDFVTQGSTEPEEEEQTEPEQTEPSEPAVQPDEPEETQAPTTAAPSYEPDGYHNQIVRP